MLVVAALLAGCAASSPPAARSSNTLQPPWLDATARRPQPLDLAELPTTSAQVYLGNLDARLEVIRGRAADGDADWLLQLAQMLYFRGRLHSNQAELERAGRVLDEARSAGADGAAALLLEARLASAFHRFDDTLAALERAATAGADPRQLAELRAQTELALGRVEAAERLAATLPEADFGALAFRANLRVEHGDLDGAELLFDRAQRVYRSSNPYPLAWLHTQHGIALLRHGQVERAREYFEAAWQRLPRFVFAAEHLAETEVLIGDPARALQLYRELLQHSDDPAFLAAMAQAQRALGQHEAAAASEAEAAAGYARALERHPLAHADHGAEFLSGRGEHPRALALARDNHALRSSTASAVLLAEVAHAAGRGSEACAAYLEARAGGLNPPELAALGETLGECR